LRWFDPAEYSGLPPITGEILILSEESTEALIPIIIAFNCSPVTNERVEHHSGIHQGIIPASPAPEIGECTRLRCQVQAFSHPDPLAVDAVRAMAVYRNIPVRTGNGDTAFCGIALELKGLHKQLISSKRYENIDGEFSPEKYLLYIEIFYIDGSHICNTRID
jgi:hypothetical protein